MAKRHLPLGGAIPMEPGERDRPVTVEQLTETIAPSGFSTATWTTLTDRVWMRKLQMGQRERFAAGQVAGAPDTQWEMGYRADMDPDLVDVVKTRRLVYQGWIYEIVSADQIGRQEGIELLTAGRKAEP